MASSESEATGDKPQLIIECSKPVGNLVRECIHLFVENEEDKGGEWKRN